jgi:hypothetical protein
VTLLSLYFLQLFGSYTKQIWVRFKLDETVSGRVTLGNNKLDLGSIQVKTEATVQDVISKGGSGRRKV